MSYSVPATSAEVPAASYSNTYRNFVLFMLLSVSVLNLLDRQILAILLEPIKAEFGLSDTQLGFLTGFSFALLYSILGIPLARIADRGNRRNLIAFVVALWSAMSALCGAAVGYVSLLLARVGVGVGEAGSFPAGTSMVADYFEPARRATALSVQSVGVYVGILFGFLLGGWINEFFGWRMAFLVVGLPGVLFAIIFRLTVKEPKRGATEGLAQVAAPPGLGETLRALWSKPAYRHLPFAAGFYAFVAYGGMNWAPSYFIRTFGMSSGEVGTWLALTIGVAGGAGCYLGGVISDRLATRYSDERWYAWVPAGSVVLSVPFVLGMYLWPDARGALIISIGAWFLGNSWLGPLVASIQGLAEPRMRALAVAIMMFVNNLLGIGLGPLVVGYLSDLFQDSLGAESLRYALIVSLLAGSVLCAFHFFMAARTLRADLVRASA
jgi:predicted MFS family arabinose efflux permease